MSLLLPLEVRYTPRADDYVQGIRSFYQKHPSTRYAVILLVFMLTMSTLAVFVLGTRYIGMALFLVLIPTFMLGAQFVLTPALTARQVHQNERLRAETTWIVQDDRIKIVNNHSESAFDWETFQRFQETDTLFLLVYSTNKNMFQILPKRAFQSQEQQEQFRTLLSQKLKQK